MNRRWRLGLLAIGVMTTTILCSPGIAEAQGVSVNSFLDWNFLGGGARARGMGGAYLGVSDGGHAASWNPAGLVHNEGVLVTLNYGFTRYAIDMDNGPFGSAKTPASIDRNLGNIPSGAFVAPLTLMEREFILSAYYNRLQQGFTQHEFRADEDPILGSPFMARIGLDANVAVTGGAFGTSINDNLSIGGSLNIVTGDGTEFYRLDLDSTRFPDPKNEHNEKVYWTTTSDIDYGGFYFTAALLYSADRWSAGLVVTPPWTLRQNLDFRSRRYTINSGVLAVHPNPDGIFGPLEGTDREIDIPFTLGLGGSYDLSENLLLAFDYQYRGFHGNSTSESDDGSSGFRTQNEPENPIAPLEDLPVDWYNLHQFRFGMEYRHETEKGTIPFRVGIRNEPLLIGNFGGADVTFDQRLDLENTAEMPYFIPVSEAFQNGDGSGLFGGQINAVTFSLGSGIHWSRIKLDFAFEFSGYDYEEGGSLNMIRRCPTCDLPPVDPDVSFPGTGEGQDVWGKRKTYRWGAYQRIYDQSRTKFFLNFTGYF